MNTIITKEVDPKELPDQISLVWTVSDVKCVRPDLSREECREVLAVVERMHDATLGVTWDTLEDAAEELFPLDDATSRDIAEFKSPMDVWDFCDDFDGHDAAWAEWKKERTP